MTPEQWLQIILQGGSTGALLLNLLWSRDGTIRWGKTTTEQLDDLRKQNEQLRQDHETEVARMTDRHNAEISRLNGRNDELWSSLKESVAALSESTAAAKQATALAETTVRARRVP